MVFAYATVMTREGVSDPSKLSGEARKLFYQNGNAPRFRQGVNRERKGNYNARGVRPAHHDGERF